MKQFKVIRLGVLMVVMTLCGCASGEKHGETSFVDSSPPVLDYDKTLERWTNTDKAYGSFEQTFGVTATLLSQDLRQLQIRRESDQYHWTPEQFQEAQNKSNSEMQSETKFLVGLYTQKNENNNLDKTKSTWAVYVDIGGRRVSPAGIKRVYETGAELAAKYPYANNWYRYYVVTFPVSTFEAQAQKTDLVISGFLGNAKLVYPKP